MYMCVSLRNKIISKDAIIGVVGLGYVGFPLAMEFCKAGYQVVGFDVNPGKLQVLKQGKSYIPDVASEVVNNVMHKQLFTPTANFDELRRIDAVSICVPTPLSKSKDPDISHIVAAVHELGPRLHSPMLVILESTTYPGTTEEILQKEIENRGYRVGTDIFVCFSPERVDPGNTIFRTANIPKIVGGVTPTCTEMGVLLYSQIIEKVVTVSSARAAEMVKLLENTFRAVNIGLANEMALMCERLGIDIWEVIDAAATKPFGFMPFYPGPGIGGHCIPLDPAYLSWKAKMYNFYNRFIDLASDINSNMPYHVSRKIGEVLNLEGKSISTSMILCLGLSYKKDVNDIRESPSLDVMRLLIKLGADVKYNDPYIPEYSEGDFTIRSVPLTARNIGSADCVVLLTDHSVFDYQFIAKHAQLILDTRNAFKGVNYPNVFRIGAPIPDIASWRRIKSLPNEAAAAGEIQS